MNRLKELELRIGHLENQLGFGNESPQVPSHAQVSLPPEDDEDALETRVGESWFARVGIAVFVLGVMFLLALPYEHFPSYVPSMIGYVFVLAMFVLSRHWMTSYQHVARYLLGGAMVLLYFATFRLFHFGVSPAVGNGAVEFILLLAVVILDIIVALTQQSPYLFILSLVLGLLTSLQVENPLVTFVIIALVAILSTVTALQKQWKWILVPVLLCSYFTHLLLSFHIPLFGNQAEQQLSSFVPLAFMLFYALLFGVTDFLSIDEQKEDGRLVIDAVLNGFVSYTLLFILTVTVFKNHFAVWHLIASGMYLTLAISFWRKVHARYVTFAYAMLGYGALSIAIISLSTVPDVFVWLCWQSVLVLTTAVGFRSRFIVVANFFIFLAVYVAYLLLAGAVGVISISFGIVALLSARILNWKKERLELRTELMRNAYLACALFVLPYALYHVLPPGYISISCLGLAVFYYLAGRLLHNRKYRWMALLTISLTVVYVFTIDLVGIDPLVRVISFLVLGSTLLMVSMVYSRRSKRAHRTGS